ncbi:hypothetical protein [Noviherbaspirillum aerium]|uniref:hypothetical protein n=1 Tax=Noviherbaspirillum aerium TaxID=2588497 RepID=UPI00124D7EF3|nr:hypothetical protein [Noviherbaspirillum aerium]
MGNNKDNRPKKSPQTFRQRANPILGELEETGATISSGMPAVRFIVVISGIAKIYICMAYRPETPPPKEKPARASVRAFVSPNLPEVDFCNAILHRHCHLSKPRGACHGDNFRKSRNSSRFSRCFGERCAKSTVID